MFVAAMASEAIQREATSVRCSMWAPAWFRPTAGWPAPSRSAASSAGSGGEPTEAYAALEAEFAGMHWVHSLNNTALVAYALEAGGGDFDRSIALTVMGGWDTDSNGATVGAMTGALDRRDRASRRGGPTRCKAAS